MTALFKITEEDLRSSRQTVINWPLFVQAVVDGYCSNGSGIPHGVQKDAIQNSWDARKDKKSGEGWSTRFELLEKDGLNLFYFEDHGTFGLTGRILKPEELQKDLPIEERWGRFENLAFTKDPSEGNLGSRGRGKVIFVGASKDKTILYETLRDDGVYRFGFRTVKLTDSPVNAFNDEEGKKKFTEYTKGMLNPLNEVGTRVIIVNPLDELVEDIKSGRFVRFIGETWWEIIVRFGAAIRVVYDGKEYKSEVLDEFLLNARETKSKKVWVKKLQKLTIGSKTYRIKEFYAVCDKKHPVPDEICSIAIQRGNMKICSMPMDYASKEIGESLFGYVTLDKDFDKALLADESVEHYSFDFRKQVPGALKRYIQDELAEFGRQKLGLGIDPRRLENERRTNAERRALMAINRIASQLGLFKHGIGPNPPPPPPPPPPPVAIKLEMPYLNFPNGISRVNYGEELGDISLRVVNRKEEALKARIQLFVLFGDTVVKKFLDQDFLVKTGKEQIFGPEKEKIDQSIYSRPGEYILRARMVSLEGEEKGVPLDEISRHFYVEQDPPPLGGVFENCKSADFPAEVAELMGYPDLGSRRGSYILVYNKNHPAKKAVDQEEDDLTDYIFRLMVLSLPWIDFRENTHNPKLFKKPATGKLDGEHITRQLPDIVSRVLYLYYNQ